MDESLENGGTFHVEPSVHWEPKTREGQQRDDDEGDKERSLAEAWPMRLLGMLAGVLDVKGAQSRSSA